MKKRAARAARKKTRLTVRLGLLVATVLALALVVTLRREQPSFEQKTAPMLLHAAAGEPVEARGFSVRVGKVKLAHAYRIDDEPRGGPGREVRADGSWMSALVEVERLQSNGYVGAQLRTRDGRRYRAAPKARPDLKGFNLTDTYLVAGLPANGGYFFDVPATALEGASLQFFAGKASPAQLDHLVDVDLGLDAADVQAMLAEASPMLDLRTPEPTE